MEIPRQFARQSLQAAPSYRASSGFGQDSAVAVRQAADTVGGVAATFGRQLVEARQVADLSAAQSAAGRDLNDLVLELEQDTDWRTIPVRFNDRARAIQDRYVGGLDDAQVRSQFQAAFGKTYEAHRVSLGRRATELAVDEGKAELKLNLHRYAQQVANAPNDNVRTQLIAQAQSEIVGKSAAGIIGQEDAVTEMLGFRSDIDEAAFRQVMARDPAAALEALEDPENFTFMEEATRARFLDTAIRRVEADDAARARADEKRERAAERELKRRGDAAMREILSRNDAGTLDRGYVEEVRETLTPTMYKNALILTDPDANVESDDPETLREIERALVTDPARAQTLLERAHVARLIRNETFSSKYETARSFARQEGARSEAERTRAYVVGLLDPGEAVDDPVGRFRAANALDEYDRFLAEGNRSDAEIYQFGRDLVRRYQFINVQQMEVALPQPYGTPEIPRYATVSEQEAALARADAALREKYDAGEVVGGNFDRSVEALDAWRRLIAQKRRAVELAAEQGSR